MSLFTETLTLSDVKCVSEWRRQAFAVYRQMEYASNCWHCNGERLTWRLHGGVVNAHDEEQIVPGVTEILVNRGIDAYQVMVMRSTYYRKKFPDS